MKNKGITLNQFNIIGKKNIEVILNKTSLPIE